MRVRIRVRLLCIVAKDGSSPCEFPSAIRSLFLINGKILLYYLSAKFIHDTIDYIEIKRNERIL